MEIEKNVTPVVLADGKLVTIKEYPRSYPNRRKGITQTEWNKATRVYVDEIGESIFENLQNRFGRPVDEYRKAALEALKHIGLDARLVWSQKAGCSCGCSPGFILRSADGKRAERRVTGEYRPVDIYITIEKGALGESTPRVLIPAATIVTTDGVSFN